MIEAPARRSQFGESISHRKPLMLRPRKMAVKELLVRFAGSLLLANVTPALQAANSEFSPARRTLHGWAEKFG